MLQARPTPRWPFWVILCLAPLVFFATEHNLKTSQAEAFTQNADQMLATAEGGNTIRRISFPLLGTVGLLLAFSPVARTFRWSPVLLAAVFFLMFWCGASVVWSIDSGMTLRRLLVLYCVILGAWGAARHLSLVQLLWLALLPNLVFLGIGFLAELGLGTFRPWAGDYRFSGTVHPNSQGLNLAAMCFASICLLRTQSKHRGFLWSVFWVGLTFLYLTKSRTSFLGVLLSLAVIWSLSVPFFYKFATVCLGGWMCSLAAILLMLAGTDLTESASDAALMGREEQAESLTGRLPLWTELSNYAGESLLVGHGYESFWTPRNIEAVSDELGWGLREAHNSYLEAILGIGLIGLFTGVVIYGVGLFHASNSAIATKHPGYAFLVAMYFFGLMNACTESAMMTVSFFTFLLGCGTFHLAMNPVETKPQPANRVKPARTRTPVLAHG